MFLGIIRLETSPSPTVCLSDVCGLAALPPSTPWVSFLGYVLCSHVHSPCPSCSNLSPHQLDPYRAERLKRVLTTYVLYGADTNEDNMEEKLNNMQHEPLMPHTFGMAGIMTSGGIYVCMFISTGMAISN